MADSREKNSHMRSRSYSSEEYVDRKSERPSERSSFQKSENIIKSRKRSRSRSKSSDDDRQHSHSHSHRSRRRSSSSSSEETKPKRKRKSKKLSSKERSRNSSASSSSSQTSSSDSNSKDERRKPNKSKAKRKEKLKKKKKRKKKSKKQDTKSLSAVNQNKYGKYGIITEADLFTKQPEYNVWLQEIKKISPETISKFETRKHFETFMEDYNTATLPHKKYYNIEQWEMKKSAKVRLKALKKAQKNPVLFADDEAKHSSKFRGGDKRYGLSREKIMEMKRAIREKTEQEYKKNVGFDPADKK